MLALLALAVWLYLFFAHGRFWSSTPELLPASPAETPDVDVVVPARDEAETIGRVIESLLAQQYAGRLRVLLVDDGSSDDTVALARAAVAEPARPCTFCGLTPSLTVVTGAPKPPGWSGKLWAVSQGVAISQAPVLLLADADIVHDPRHLATLVARLNAPHVEMVSEMVRLNCSSLAERSLVPAFVYFFQMLYPFAKVNEPHSRVAAAAGGTVLIRREALDRIGGIAAIKGALIDDVTLAKRVKLAGSWRSAGAQWLAEAGGPAEAAGAGSAEAADEAEAGSAAGAGAIYLGHTGLAASIRPYPRFADIWQMIARTAFTQLRYSAALLVLTLIGLALVWWVPLGEALLGHGWRRMCGLAAFVLSAASYWPTLARYERSRLWSLALPLIAAFYMGATLSSALKFWRGKGARWKNRDYGDTEH